MLLVAAEQGFYELAAQIIPVLLLVLFIGEDRLIRGESSSSDGWRSTALLGLGATAVMLLGELAALRTVERGNDSPFLNGLTVIALVYGFTFIFAQATKLLLLGRGESISAARQAALGRFYLVAVAVVLVGSYEILSPGLLPP
jgi:hypothetical protein